ncbi:preprotein translocase subunit SecE [Aureivirga marina]|uniref:preprotein translocase subunit SecE n=1 Tax=Aureivirga marina TaxID=1182451 RepID=UPI0018C9A74D|nr:preprotein translocase subunit SecE [Aureivirga marina]
MSIVKYIKESFEELSTEVTWISWSEAQKSTVTVALFTVIFSIAVFIVDKVFQNLLENYFNLF